MDYYLNGRLDWPRDLPSPRISSSPTMGSMGGLYCLPTWIPLNFIINVYIYYMYGTGKCIGKHTIFCHIFGRPLYPLVGFLNVTH